MKAKISVSLSEETILKILDKLREGRFRTKSHVIDVAVKRFLDEKKWH